MPRITPLRVLLLGPLFYVLLILLWVILPSPNAPWESAHHDIAKAPAEEDEIEKQLWRGGSVTRVYNVDKYFSYTDSTPAVIEARSSGRESFALTYSYDASSCALTVQGHQSSHTFDLPALIDRANNGNNITANVYTGPFLTQAKTGDHDGINLPFFTRADAALLYWEIHHDVVRLPLRLAVWSKGYEMDRPTYVTVQADREEFYATTAPAKWARKDVLLLLSVDPSHPKRSLRGALWPGDIIDPTSSVDQVENQEDIPQNSSPSRTFPIRRAIEIVLVPSWFFISDIVIPLVEGSLAGVIWLLQFAFWLSIVYIVVVLACWKASHTPAFWPWARRSRMTRDVVRYVSAKLAPMRSVDGEDDENEDMPSVAETSGRRPTPLTSPWGFFTSSSPLDDLFVTFEVTRPLVLQIRLRQRQTGDLEEQTERSIPLESGKELMNEKGSGEGSESLP